MSRITDIASLLRKELNIHEDEQIEIVIEVTQAPVSKSTLNTTVHLFDSRGDITKVYDSVISKHMYNRRDI